MTNIVLTGFMGTGKTTVGHLLASRMGYGFVDTDLVIEERFGPIPTIFAERGEDGFRSIERAAVADLATLTRSVISTGGRAMLDDANVAAFAGTARTVCLAASPDHLVGRLLADSHAEERPLLAGNDPEAEIRALLDQRAEAYGRFPQLNTSGATPAELAEVLSAEFAADPSPGTERVTMGAGSLALVAAQAPMASRIVLRCAEEHLEWMAALTGAHRSTAFGEVGEPLTDSDHLVVVGDAHQSDDLEAQAHALECAVTVVPTTLAGALRRLELGSPHCTLVEFGILQYSGARDVPAATVELAAAVSNRSPEVVGSALRSPSDPAFFGLMRSLLRSSPIV